MTKDKGFYKNFFTICILLMLQNVVALSVNLADNIMLGAYSETALSGVAAVNQIQFIYQQLLMGIGDGMVILASQYWGKQQTEPMKRIASIAMWSALTIMGILFVTVSIFPREVVGLFTDHAGIIEEGCGYLSIVRFTYIFFCITTIMLATMRSVGTVKIAFYMSLLALVINCSLNWVFIYGKLGMPEMGAKGAAIGTLAARMVECAVVCAYVWKKDRHLCIRLKDYFSFDGGLGRDFLKICAPIILVQGLWGLNTAMQTAILGHMTASAIAANSMASNLYMIVKAAAVGAAAAASVLIGQTIGSGNMKKVKEYAKTLQILFVGMGIVCSILLFLIIDPVLSLYQLTPETREMAKSFLLVLCVAMLGMSYQMPVNIGIIRGGGDSKYVMKLDIISVWVIVMPLSFFMAFIVKASPLVVVCCLNADQIFKCIPGFIKVNFGNWAKKLTR